MNDAIPQNPAAPLPQAPAHAPAHAPTRAAPVATDEREISLDILRGFALFGVLAVNLQLWFRTNPLRYSGENFPYPALVDRIADGLRMLFFDGRFMSLFAFLFGVGVSIQFERAEARTGRPRR